MEELRQLSIQLGGPGVVPLWLAARRAGLDVKRKDVEAFVRRKGEKQIFQAPQPAAGKTVSGGEEETWMADLIDMRFSPATEGDETYTTILVCVNVFDRFTWTRALKSKSPQEVKDALQAILTSATRPKVIATDGGAEFQKVGELGVAHRTKAPTDVNSLGVVDRTIQTLTAKLKEFSSKTRQPWPSLLARATQALNRTPKPVLHGESPEDVSHEPSVRFMLQQDNARNFKHNQSLTDRRKAKLEKDGAFRGPVATKAGLKRPLANFGPAEKVRSIKGGIVTAESGLQYPLKAVRAIPVDSTDVEPRFGADTATPAKKRKIGGPVLDKLEELLKTGGPSLALTRASQLLRDAFSGSRSYDDAMKEVGGRLVELIRLDPRFELMSKSAGNYFVKLRDDTTPFSALLSRGRAG
jgi:hypothetical protein